MAPVSTKYFRHKSSMPPDTSITLAPVAKIFWILSFVISASLQNKQTNKQRHQKHSSGGRGGGFLSQHVCFYERGVYNFLYLDKDYDLKIVSSIPKCIVPPNPTSSGKFFLHTMLLKFVPSTTCTRKTLFKYEMGKTVIKSSLYSANIVRSCL